MRTDPRSLKPSQLCQLLNSTPLGEVIDQRTLARYRERAGMHIGDQSHVDLLRLVVWLVRRRHTSSAQTKQAPIDSATRERERLRPPQVCGAIRGECR